MEKNVLQWLDVGRDTGVMLFEIKLLNVVLNAVLPDETGISNHV